MIIDLFHVSVDSNTHLSFASFDVYSHDITTGKFFKINFNDILSVSTDMKVANSYHEFISNEQFTNEINQKELDGHHVYPMPIREG
jgi:hypothetical protein